mmetsp:Transcript_83153/g.269033  ORF Transcript_83153/g.269033 Transcript_83153/m.269033 type:complete len:235 (-) Transcript_83153:265-969(-)
MRARTLLSVCVSRKATSSTRTAAPARRSLTLRDVRAWAAFTAAVWVRRYSPGLSSVGFLGAGGRRAGGGGAARAAGCFGRSPLKTPCSRARERPLRLASLSRSAMPCSLSCRASSSFWIRSRSGRPTMRSSILARASFSSSRRPSPSSAQALRNQALWSWSSILMASSAAVKASVQRPSFMAACAMFLRTAMCMSAIILFPCGSLSGSRCLRTWASACLQAASASMTLPLCHSM